MNPSNLSSSARARLREPRTRRLVAVGLIGAVGLSAAAIPAFAQNPPSMAKTLTTLAEERVVVASSAPTTSTTAAPAVTTTVPAPTTTTTTAPPPPPVPTPEEQARAALAAATPEQQVAFRLLFMSDAERAAFLRLFAPPPPPPPAPVVVKPAPVVVKPAVPAAPAPAGPTPAADRGALWDRLAQCEAGGNWHINTGNGYQGGLQFHPGTWTSMGGGQYASGAHLATREQQIDIAERVVAAAGGTFRAWPGCRAKLGLP